MSKFRKGDWVKSWHGQIGKVTRVYRSRKAAGAVGEWYNVQSKKPKDPSKTWYSVLVYDGGSVSIPEEGLIKTKPISPGRITNSWWNTHFPPRKRTKKKLAKTKGGR